MKCQTCGYDAVKGKRFCAVCIIKHRDEAVKFGRRVQGENLDGPKADVPSTFAAFRRARED